MTDSIHPEVLTLARAVVREGGSLAFPEGLLVAHLRTFAALPAQGREKATGDLVVLAGRLRREVPQQSERVVAQLLALVTLLLGSGEEALARFKEGGVDVAEARKLLAQEGIKFEDSAEKEPGKAAASLMGVLKGNR